MLRRLLTFTLLIATIVGIGPLGSAAAAPAAVTANELRSLLTAQLGEHVELAMMATNAALNGTPAEFEAAAAAVDENSVALADSIALVYGEEAGETFLPLWRKHIEFFVDYTNAAAADDQAGMDEARANLDGYREDFGAFISGANPNLPKDAVAEALLPHVATLTAVIDAQAAQDYAAAYDSLGEAYAHAGMLGATLSGGIAQQFPAEFDGMTDSSLADLQAGLTGLLGEHVMLTSFATNAALSGRQAEFEAAAASLDGNSVDLSNAIASVYGEDAGDAFLPLWRRHIDFFVTYTLGAASGDQAMKDEARANLDGYRADFGAFIGSANPNLPSEAVAEALVPHVATLSAMIDSQATADYPAAFASVRRAFAHSGQLAATLAGGIAQQFPQQFDSGAMPAMPDTGRGGESGTPWAATLLIVVALLSVATLAPRARRA